MAKILQAALTGQTAGNALTAYVAQTNDVAPAFAKDTSTPTGSIVAVSGGGHRSNVNSVDAVYYGGNLASTYNLDVQVDIEIKSVPTLGIAGLVFGLDGAGAFTAVRLQGATLQVWTRVNGSVLQIGTSQVVTLVAGTTYRILSKVRGSAAGLLTLTNFFGPAAGPLLPLGPPLVGGTTANANYLTTLNRLCGLELYGNPLDTDTTGFHAKNLIASDGSLDPALAVAGGATMSAQDKLDIAAQVLVTLTADTAYKQNYELNATSRAAILSAINAAVIDGTITRAQKDKYDLAVDLGVYALTRNSATQDTILYKDQAGATIATVVQTWAVDASSNRTYPTGRTVTFA